MDEVLSELEAEYCPPIDPALLSAIVSDHDLNDLADLQLARSTLDSLKESALLEEAAGFDASGTGGLLEDGIAMSCQGKPINFLMRRLCITSQPATTIVYRQGK